MTSDAPFNPADPFDATIEDLRKSLTLSVAFHIENHQPMQLLDHGRRYQAVMIALLVTTTGCLDTLTLPGNEKHMLRAIKSYLPEALRIAREIAANGEMEVAKGEAKH
jgi:hypothetical protein